MNDFDVMREAQVDEGLLGEQVIGGKDAAFVRAQFSLEVGAVELCPALVRFGGTVWWAHDVDIITIRNDEEVGELCLEGGERVVDGQGEKEATQ